jgi:indolepyruvate ferredoxin oxidoreductase beta subunit
VVIPPDSIAADSLPNKKALNVALLGVLSAHLPMPEEVWLEQLEAAFDPAFHQANREAFLAGRKARNTVA